MAVLDLLEDVRSQKKMWGILAERLGRAEAFIEMLGYDLDDMTSQVTYDPEKDKRRM